MRLGISSFSYTWGIGLPGSLPQGPMGLHDLLDEAVRLNVGIVQVAHNIPLDQVPPAELDRFEKRAAELGIQVELAVRGIQPDQLRRDLEMAVRFKAPFLRTVIDSPGHKPTPAEAVAILKPFQSEFQAAGIKLVLENHDRFGVHTLVDILHSLGHEWTGICLDTANSFGALEGPRVVVETLAPYTINLHLKDLTVYRTYHTMNFIIEGRPVGQGMLDIPWILGEVMRYNQDASVILEMWTPPEEKLENTIQKEKRWVEESVSYLRERIHE